MTEQRNTAKHTPGPLHVTVWPGDADNVPNGCSIGIDDQFGADGGRDYFLFTAVHGDPDELAANAARLVAAWNSYDACLSALRQAERLLDSVAFVAVEGDTSKPLRAIRAAIAKATGA